MATLSLALYNGATTVGNALASNLGAVYLFIAVVGALWSYYVYMRRAKEIRERSPKHMDDRIGPVIIGVALIIALCANFAFKVYRTKEFRLILVRLLVAGARGTREGDICCTGRINYHGVAVKMDILEIFTGHS